LLHADIADDFLAELAKRAASVPVGDPLDEATRVGALNSSEHLGKIETHLRAAREAGAQVRAGGERLTSDGLFLAPTIVEGVTTSMAIASAEVFGPVVVALTFKSAEEAIDIANATDYGLSASVWSRDLDTAIAVGRGVKAGTVWVNTFMDGAPELPFRRLSAVGRRSRTWPQRRQGLHRGKDVPRPYWAAHELVASAERRRELRIGSVKTLLATGPDRFRWE
jgi:betaine-aldehyde dehydrogenase